MNKITEGNIIPAHEFNADGCITPFPEPRRKNCGWTEERRQRQREAIKQWQPWHASTGPRTVDGKARASMNALRHGHRTAHVRRFCALIRHQQRFLALVQANLRQNIFHANELLDFVRQIPGNTPLCPTNTGPAAAFMGKSP